MLSVEAAGNNGLSSGTNGLQVRRKAQNFRRWMRRASSSNECQYVREWLFLLRGPKVRSKLPALAAQPRAFSSLLSLPSQAQSVIKAFRRQGIGSADVFNTARFFLSRLESLFAAQKVFQIFCGRAGARLCQKRQPPSVRLFVRHPHSLTYGLALFLPYFVPPYRSLPLQPQTRLIPASASWRSSFLV